MRDQIPYEQNDQEDVYIAIQEEKVLQEGSIKLYKNVLNECVRNTTVDPLVRDYILEEYKGFKFMFRTRKEILNFAESLHQEFNRWKESPEREEKLKSLILCRSRRNYVICMITSALILASGVYAVRQDEAGLATVSFITGGIIGSCSIHGMVRLLSCLEEEEKVPALPCVENRLSHNLDKKHVYSIFSSKNLIRDDKEFRGLLESEAGKIENICQIVTSYHLI